jgi:NAD-dependent deacetylase
MMPHRRTLDPAECAGLIKNAGSVVALTGAGISTASGIPDFRGPQGLYVTRRYDPEKVFDIDWFRHSPGDFYEFSRDLVEVVKDVRPTFSHHFLAELEKAGSLTAVITQNIDMLHQMAGSRRVVELHGSYHSATCLACARQQLELSHHWWRQAMTLASRAPVVSCPDCGGILKPDIVFFGELVIGFGQAQTLVRQCDLLLVLGSSLQVSPASYLARDCRAAILVVNQGEVLLSGGSGRYFVDRDLDGHFREVAKHLGMAVR